VRSLHSFDGHDLPTELEELHARVARVEEEHVTVAGEMVALVVEASNTLMDLGMLPIWEVPQNPKKAQDSSRWQASSWSACKRLMPMAPVPRTKRRPTAMFLWPRAILLVVFFFLSLVYIYIYILETCVSYIPAFLGP
jgi:hypothetical protein